MLEIELFQREPSCGMHVLKIWINGGLKFANEICPYYDIVDLRDSLHNELLWLNSYLEEKEIESKDLT